VNSSHAASTGYEFREDIPANHNMVHTDHVVTLLVEGELRANHGDEFTITPGMLTLVPAGVPHGQIKGKGIGIWWLSFCTSCLNMDESHSLMAAFQRVRLGALPVFQLPKGRQAYFVTLLKELKDENERSEPDSLHIVKSLLMLILNEVKKSAEIEQERFTRKSSTISKALEFIQKHSLSPISLKDVADAIHLSPAYLATTMKKSTGYSVGDWIARSRLTEACSRLRHTDERVDSIAIQVGWNDVTHFIRQFKRAYGTTPAIWRKKHKIIISD